MSNPTAADQVISFVGEFILGSIAILAIYVAYWTIKQWRADKDAHIQDLHTAAKVKSEEHRQHAEAYQRTAQATIAAIEKLTQTESTQTDAIRENTRTLTDLRGAIDSQRGTLDSVVREAVVRRRTSSDRMPRVKPEEKE